MKSLMQRVDEVTHLVIGECYLVDCICLDKTDDPQFDVRVLEEWNRYRYLPILGPPHTDEVIKADGSLVKGDLGFIPAHYHLDQRFMTDKQIKERVILFVESFLKHTSDPLERLNQPQRLREITRPMKCLRNDFPNKVILRHIARRYYDAIAIHDRCPHRGCYLGNLPVHNNCVQCPMHGLKFNVHTKKCTGEI
jgi:hypothetical protein